MTRTLTTPTDRTAAPNLTDHSDACSCRGAAHPLLPRSGSSASAAIRSTSSGPSSQRRWLPVVAEPDRLADARRIRRSHARADERNAAPGVAGGRGVLGPSLRGPVGHRRQLRLLRHRPLGLPPPARDQPAGHLGDRRQPELHRRPRGERVRPPGRAAGRPLYRTRRLIAAAGSPAPSRHAGGSGDRTVMPRCARDARSRGASRPHTERWSVRLPGRARFVDCGLEPQPSRSGRRPTAVRPP